MFIGAAASDLLSDDSSIEITLLSCLDSGSITSGSLGLVSCFSNT